MKIAILSTFYPFRGGIAQFNALLYRELEKEHETEAYTFIRQYPNLLFPGQTQYVGPDDVADKIPAKPILDTINPFTYFRTARKLLKVHPDLVLTKYWMTFFAPSLGFILGRMQGKTKRISILDNVIPHEKRFFDNILNRYFLRRNDGFIVMSDKVLKDLLSFRPDAKYLRINHPVYNQFGLKLDKEIALNNLGLDSTRNVKRLLFFGIIRDYKGLDLLIKAMALLAGDYELIIAGEVYGSFDKYQEIIDHLNLKSKIKLFNHYIPDDQVTNFFSASDVCVLPYKSATQSGIISISKHFEVPIIATDVGGLKESFEHLKSGYLVNEISPLAIAQGIDAFFEKSLDQSCTSYIQTENKENSWESFAKKLISFSKEL